MFRFNARAAATAALVVGVTTISGAALAGPAVAAPSQAAVASSDSVTRVEVMFDHPVTLSDAVDSMKPTGDLPVAYRIEGSGVVAEWAPDSQPAAAFTKNFLQDFGIEPEVVGYFVEVHLPSVRDAAKHGKLPVRSTRVASNAPVFHSPAVPQQKKDQIATRSKVGSVGSSAVVPQSTESLSTSWWATNSHFEIYRASGYQYIYTVTNYAAGGHASIPAGFGMEIGVDLYNNATGTRGGVPACGPGFRDQFIAKNYDWPSWEAFSPDGDVSAARPYADYNDLFDSCGRNAMTIGFQYGNLIPGTQLYTVIQAPPGVAASSQLGAGAQLVDNNACTPIETNGVGGATDCMGILMLTPSGVDPNETLLATRSHTSVGYLACWDTVVSGGVPHATWFSDPAGYCGL